MLDAIPFTERIDFNIESSGSNRTSWFHLQYAVNTFWYAKPGAVSNRKPLPEMAARKLITLEELQAFNEICKKNKYVFPGAIEAENIDTYQVSNGVQLYEGMTVWGELSNGTVKAFAFSQEGQEIEVRLTELFDKVPLKVCLITGNGGGEFDIKVNGEFVRNVNLASEHSAVTTIDLGEFDPIDNALRISFVCKRSGNLGIDYFLTK